MAGTYSFSLDQGAVWDEEIQYTVDGVSVDLSGYHARLVAKAKPGVTASVDISDGSGITLDSQGYIRIAVPGTATQGYSWKSPVPYKLYLTPATGGTFVFLSGTLSLELGLLG